MYVLLLFTKQWTQQFSTNRFHGWIQQRKCDWIIVAIFFQGNFTYLIELLMSMLQWRELGQSQIFYNVPNSSVCLSLHCSEFKSKFRLQIHSLFKYLVHCLVWTNNLPFLGVYLNFRALYLCSRATRQENEPFFHFWLTKIFFGYFLKFIESGNDASLFFLSLFTRARHAKLAHAQKY